MDKEKVLISFPSSECGDSIFDIFTSMPGYEDKSKEDLYVFLATETLERDAFLEEHTTFSFITVGDSEILKIRPK